MKILIAAMLLAAALWVVLRLRRRGVAPPWRVARATLRADLARCQVASAPGRDALTVTPMISDPAQLPDVEWSARIDSPGGLPVEIYQETARVAPLVFAWRSAVQTNGRMALYRAGDPMLYELRRMAQNRRGLQGLDRESVPPPVAGVMDVFLDEPGLGDLIFGTELVATLGTLSSGDAEVAFEYDAGTAYLHLQAVTDGVRSLGAPPSLTDGGQVFAVLPLVDRVEDALRRVVDGPPDTLTVEIEGREVALWTPRGARGRGRN